MSRPSLAVCRVRPALRRRPPIFLAS